MIVSTTFKEILLQMVLFSSHWRRYKKTKKNDCPNIDPFITANLILKSIEQQLSVLTVQLVRMQLISINTMVRKTGDQKPWNSIHSFTFPQFHRLNDIVKYLLKYSFWVLILNSTVLSYLAYLKFLEISSVNEIGKVWIRSLFKCCLYLRKFIKTFLY